MPAILAVDDERDFLTSYERLLGRSGYRVIGSSTRHEGLAVIASERLALGISDLRLPDGDGLDIVRAARRAPAPVPVIVVTGFASEVSRLAALGAGAAGYLAKPFAASELAALGERTGPSR